MEEVTNNVIGETETLLATGLGGVFYGFLSVQPLVVLAFTGPVLLYESIIFRVCGCVCMCVYLYRIFCDDRFQLKFCMVKV